MLLYICTQLLLTFFKIKTPNFSTISLRIVIFAKNHDLSLFWSLMQRIKNATPAKQWSTRSSDLLQTIGSRLAICEAE